MSVNKGEEKRSFGGLVSLGSKSLSLDDVNFKNEDTEKMNSNKAMTGENEEYKVPITGMKSSSSYFNLGMALRGQMEKKAKSQGFESLSDRTSKRKAKRVEERATNRTERKAKRSINREIKGIKKEYKKNLN
jgi:hypothetical protein